MKQIIAFLAFILMASPAGATNYYVNTASEGGDGTTTATTGAQAAFATIAAAQAAVTGDQSDNFLLFNKGNTWREQFTVGANGTAGHPFTIGNYGTGANPIINGADLVGTWTDNSTVTGVCGTEYFSDNFDDNNTTDWTDSGGGTYAAQNQRLEVTVSDGGTDSIYRSGSAVAELWGEYKVTYLSAGLTLNSGATLQFGGVASSQTLRAYASVYNNAGTNVFRVHYQNDAGTQASITAVPCAADTQYTILIHYKAATGAGNNDGVVQMWANGTELINLSDVDSDTLTVNGAKVGNASASSGVYGTVYIDDAKIGTTGTAPSAGVADTWCASVTTQPYQVFFDGVKGTLAANVAALNAENEWFWDANDLCVYSPTDPDTAYTSPGIESSARRYGILVSAKNYVTISGIDTTKAGAVNTSSYNISLSNTGNCIVTGGVTSHGYHSGIFVGDGGDNNLITLVEATLNGQNEGPGIGVWNPGADDNEISYCNSHDNYGSGITNHGLEASTDGPERTHIHHNTVTNNGRRGISVTMATDTIVEYNTVTGSGQILSTSGEGIKMSSGDLETIYNDGNITRFNFVGGNAYGGIVTYREGNFQIYHNIVNTNAGDGVPGISISTYGDGVVYNNTVYNSENYNIGVQTPVGVGVVTLKNNILHTSSARTGGIYIATNAASNFVSDYNDVYGTTYFGVLQTGGGKSLADWRTATSQDANSIATDPLFVSTVTPDFHLLPLSPARRAGVNVGLTSDYAGRFVKPTPDIGAYQYPANSRVPMKINGKWR